MRCAKLSVGYKLNWGKTIKQNKPQENRVCPHRSDLAYIPRSAAGASLDRSNVVQSPYQTGRIMKKKKKKYMRGTYTASVAGSKIGPTERLTYKDALPELGT